MLILLNFFDTPQNFSLKGIFNCVHHACNVFMDRHWGRIVNCSSISAFGTTSGTVYGAAKAGVLGLANSVAWDMRDYGVTYNAIFPQTRQYGSRARRASAGPFPQLAGERSNRNARRIRAHPKSSFA